jgi:trans-2-enoyl-CoA reductase
MVLVETSEESGILTVILNRPERGNSLLDASAREFGNIEVSSTVRVILIQGNGKHLCTGGDQDEMNTWNSANKELPQYLEKFYGCFTKLRSHKVPIITCGKGVMVGGGFGIFMLGDIRIMDDNASWTPGFVQNGISPGMSIGPRLKEELGERRAKMLLLSSEFFSAQYGIQLGIVDYIGDDAFGLQLAQKLCQQYHPAVDAIFNNPDSLDYDLGKQGRLQGSLFQSDPNYFYNAKRGPNATVTLAWDNSEVTSGLMNLEVVASPVHPADLNVIEGKYPTKISGLGIEGCAKDADGSIYLVPHLYNNRLGFWRRRMQVERSEVVKLSDSILEDLKKVNGDARVVCSILGINPLTAWAMLDLVESGGVVIQNAASSMVGICVSLLATQPLTCVYRSETSRSRYRELFPQHTHLLETEVSGHYKDPTNTRPTVALNAVGGESGYRLAKALQSGGTMVTYGALSKKAAEVPNHQLIFNNINCRGFWLVRWWKERKVGDVEGIYNEILPKIMKHDWDFKTFHHRRIQHAIKYVQETGKKAVLVFAKL